jgi:hypothetical protein
MKMTIRIMLILAPLCMVVGNWHGTLWALMASILFLMANTMALIVNLKKGKS